MSEAKNPMQPVGLDVHNIARFKSNKIVRFLQEWAASRGMDLNTLAKMDFSDDDWTQFAQLIGYSVSGFGDLSYADPAIVEKADGLVEQIICRQLSSVP